MPTRTVKPNLPPRPTLIHSFTLPLHCNTPVTASLPPSACCSLSREAQSPFLVAGLPAAAASLYRMARPWHLLPVAALLLLLVSGGRAQLNQGKWKTRGYKSENEASEAAKKLKSLVSTAGAGTEPIGTGRSAGLPF